MNFSSTIAGLGSVWFVGVAIINVLSAVFVYVDADRLQRVSQTVRIFPPAMWAVVCLVGGIPATALYWVAHHSTLAK